MHFPDLLDRFLRYVVIDTQSCLNSSTTPSTANQLDLANKLQQELLELGLNDAIVNDKGYVLATLPSNQKKYGPTIALIAHMDTSPEVSGKAVKPQIHRNYDGKDIVLSESQNVVLQTKKFPYLLEKIGCTIITTDGNTLLGADNKAGVAEIMTAVNYLMQHPEIPRPCIRVLFTPDEEIGQGAEHIEVDEIKADFGYTIDGGKIGEIDQECFCAATATIKVQGYNFHPGFAKDKLVNAIKIAAQIVANLPEKTLSPETTSKKEGFIHPISLSSEVGNAEIMMILRDFSDEGLTEKKVLLQKIVDLVKQNYPKASITCTFKENYRNMIEILAKHPDIIDKAKTAITQSGISPALTYIRGGTDGARFSFKGLPTPNLFTGGNNFHSLYEWIALEDMEKASETIVRLIQLYTS